MHGTQMGDSCMMDVDIASVDDDDDDDGSSMEDGDVVRLWTMIRS